MSDDRCDLLCLDLPTAERLRRARIATDTAEAAAARAQGLADPTRLTLAAALLDPRSCVSATLPGLSSAPRTSFRIMPVP